MTRHARRCSPPRWLRHEVSAALSRVIGRGAGGVDQALELARLTGKHVVFGRTIPYRGGLYGNALLSRWPVNHLVNHELPYTPGASGGSDFHMLATHLDTSEADRLLAARRLKKLVLERPADWPMILAGDMNATPGSAIINLLEEDWTAAAAAEPLHTFPPEKPTRQIDFIFFRLAARWKVIQLQVLDESVASGHRPLLAVLEIVP